MEHLLHPSRAPLGQIALHQKLGMNHPLPPVRSYIGASGRRTHEREAWTEQFYEQRYQAADAPIDHLKFALKYEPLQLRIIVEALTQIGPSALEAWVRREPTGKYSRRAWFLYETLVEETLDLPDAQTGNYVDALDESRHFGATPQAEFLYDRLAETIQEDFKKELDFLSIFDACLAAVRAVVDMPDRRASLLVRLCLQNGGRLSNAKRPQFAELAAEEVAEIERSIQALREAAPDAAGAA